METVSLRLLAHPSRGRTPGFDLERLARIGKRTAEVFVNMDGAALVIVQTLHGLNLSWTLRQLADFVP